MVQLKTYLSRLADQVNSLRSFVDGFGRHGQILKHTRFQ